MSGNNASEIPQQRHTPPRAPGDPPSPTESELGSYSTSANIPQRSTQSDTPSSTTASTTSFSDWQLLRVPEPPGYGQTTANEGGESQGAEESLRTSELVSPLYSRANL